MNERGLNPGFVHGLDWLQHGLLDRLRGAVGGWPLPHFRIPLEELKAILADSDRIVLMSKNKEAKIDLNRLIAGGIRVPHLHVGDEIVILNKQALKDYLEAAAKEVEKIDNILDIDELIKM